MHYIIIGTAHKYQRYCDYVKSELEAIFRECTPVLIAEETKSDTDKPTYGQQIITPDRWLSIIMDKEREKDARISEALDKEFEYIEQHNIVAYDRRAQTIREEYWLNQIEEKCRELKITDGTVVITCGLKHLYFLADKALKRGVTRVTTLECPSDIRQMENLNCMHLW